MELELKLVAEQVQIASSRSRWVLLLLVAVSIFVFIAYWNTGTEEAWARRRIAHALELKRCLAEASTTASCTKGLAQFAQSGWITGPLPQEQLEPGQEGRLSASTRAHQLKELDEYVSTQRKLYQEKVVFVQAPLLPISFDINDLGFFAGVVFTALLGMLAFALRREAQNLEFSLDWAANSENPGSLYEFLAMSQVFSLPTPRHDMSEGESRLAEIWYFASFLPLLIPALVYGLFCFNDLDTRAVGDAVASAGVKRVLATEVVCGVVIALLTASSVFRFRSIDLLWKRYAESHRQ